jgi:hypothetical protein
MGQCYSAQNFVDQPLLGISEQPKLLGAKLQDVVIMTSHNSYLESFQIFGSATLRALDLVLKRGARCLELDIYRESKHPTQLYIAHGKEDSPEDFMVSTKLLCVDGLEFLAKNAFVRNDDPLFLCLELNVHENEQACNMLADLLVFIFGERLFIGKLTAQTPLKNLLGRVIVLTGSGIAGQKLEKVINSRWGELFQNVPSSVPVKSIASPLTRVYPQGLLSDTVGLNFDGLPYLKYGVTFVAMNFCTVDNNLTKYLSWFGNSSFKLK